MGKMLFLGDPSSLPDHLRCRRSDGRQWRCPQPAKPGLRFCEHHYHQVRRHQESIKNGNVTAEASAESKRRLLLTADPPLTNKRRRKRLIKVPPVEQLILAERMKEGEVETKSSHLKVSMDLPSSDQLRHHQSDGPEWLHSPPALLSPRLYYPRNSRCKHTNEVNAKATEPRPMRSLLTNLSQRQMAEASAKEPARTTHMMQGESDRETAEPARTRDLSIPDSLRCRRSDGRKWRCYHPAMPGLRFSAPQRFSKRRQRRRGMDGEQMEEGLIRMEQNEEDREAVNLAMTGISFCDNDVLRGKADNNKIKAAESAMLDAEACKPAAPDVGTVEPMMPDLSMLDNDSMCREEDSKEYMVRSANPKHKLHLPGNLIGYDLNLKPSKKGLSQSNHVRCRRSDGRKWMCPQVAMPSIGFCEYHYIQMRRNQGKRQNTMLASTAKHKWGQPARKLRQGRVGVQLLGNGRARTKQKMDEKLEDAYLEVTRDLPNGVMAISPGTAMGLAIASPLVDRKLGSDYGLLLGRPFRSKNAERVPLAKLQMVPQI